MKQQERCVLHSPAFAALGGIAFRRAETDGTPVMVVALGDRQAALPLRALQKEFGITDDSPDGRMLALIAESLDFVAGLSLGDPLPAEVLTGQASWEPAPRFLRIAVVKLHFHLLAWLDPGRPAAQRVDSAQLDRLESDPVLQARVQRAFEQAAVELNLLGPESAMHSLRTIADELRYIEALREDLLEQAQAMAHRLGDFNLGRHVGADRHATLARVRRLSELAVEAIAARFGVVDAASANLNHALRNFVSHGAFVRSHRDWLYRSRRVWDPILAEWAAAPAELDAGLWLLVSRTYHFLAPRFMPVQEWQSAWDGLHAQRSKKPQRAMHW